MAKFTATAVGLLLIAAALLVVALAIHADVYVKGGIERTLSHVVGADIAMGDIRILPVQEGLEIRGLRVANPEGFKEGPALLIKRLLVQFDIKTVFSARRTIRRLVLDGVEVDLRYKLGDGTNLGRLAKQAATAAALRNMRDAFIVRELRCEKARVNVHANVVPFTSVTLGIAPFTLTDFGNGPVSVAEVIDIFLRSLIHETLTLMGLLSPVVNLLKSETPGETPK